MLFRSALSTHDDWSCNIRCKPGYSEGQAQILCPSDSVEGGAYQGSLACTENRCAPYNYGLGVTSGTEDPCTDGIRLSTNTDSSCNVRCADGYTTASLSVKCHPLAEEGMSVEGLECTSAVCAAPAFVPGRIATNC